MHEDSAWCHELLLRSWFNIVKEVSVITDDSNRGSIHLFVGEDHNDLSGGDVTGHSCDVESSTENRKTNLYN